MPPRSIAILGGGLTGLSSAFHLSRRFPGAHISLLERQGRLGGWVQSDRVELPGGGSVVLEGGPRTLRPNGKSVLELINLLGLEDKLIKVPKTAPPAKARFLYIPESYGGRVTGLLKLPSSIPSLFTSPLMGDLLPAVLCEPFKKPNRPTTANDESFDSFLSRRFGETFARTFGSALIHGVYASDSRKLSVQSAFPGLWQIEERGKGSIVRGFLTPALKGKPDDYDFGRSLDIMEEVSVYSFRDGMETLTNALEDHLQSSPNVEIMKNTHITSLKSLDDHSIEVSHSSGKPVSVTHVVSALPPPILHNLLSPSTAIPNLLENPTSTVHVVNFVFPCPPAKLHPEGFGYLLPRPPTGYPSSPIAPGVLGTVFDSCSLHEQDLPATANYYHDAARTKLTMMTGGPYGHVQLPSELSSSETELTPPFIRALLGQLKEQLGRDLPEPIYWRIWNNEACIPTFLPDHLSRVQEMKKVLQDGEWAGRLAVVGAGVGGVSVPDCIEAARRVGKDWI